MFKRPARPERQPMAWPSPVRGGVSTPCSTVVVGSSKFAYIRSPKLLKACRAIPCQHCGRQDGTVVAAHSNQAKHGKGRGIKASDVFVASLCFVCHAELDQGVGMLLAERRAMWDAAHHKTKVELVRRGLWPAGLPGPLYTSNELTKTHESQKL
jgi:hypothetical protein